MRWISNQRLGNLFGGRGRGRGWGGRGGGFGFGRQEPFILFPEVELPDAKDVKEERLLSVLNSRLVRFWKASPYYLQETPAKKSKDLDIERYSDWKKPKEKRQRDSLDQILQFDNFPKELVAGAKQNYKKVQWNPVTDEDKLDLFDKLEQKIQGQKGKDGKEMEEDEAEEEELEEEVEEDLSDDDYNRNIDFDDDEDDYNLEEENNDEGIY